MINLLKIRPRLLAGFGLVLALLAFSVGDALWGLSGISANTTRIVSEILSHRMEFDVQSVQRFIRTLLIDRDPREVAANQERIRSGRRTYDESSDKLGELLISSEAKAQYARVAQSRDQAREANQGIVALGLRVVTQPKDDRGVARRRVRVVEIPDELPRVHVRANGPLRLPLLGKADMQVDALGFAQQDPLTERR